MTTDTVLTGILALTVALGIVLTLFASASLGRALATLELQYERGIGGAARLQSWVTIRTHANRLLVGLVFVVVAVLTLAEVELLWRVWFGRLAFLALLVLFVGSEVADWLTGRVQLHLLVTAQAAETEGLRTRLAEAERKLGDQESGT